MIDKTAFLDGAMDAWKKYTPAGIVGTKAVNAIENHATPSLTNPSTYSSFFKGMTGGDDQFSLLKHPWDSTIGRFNPDTNARHAGMEAMQGLKKWGPLVGGLGLGAYGLYKLFGSKEAPAAGPVINNYIQQPGGTQQSSGGYRPMSSAGSNEIRQLTG